MAGGSGLGPDHFIKYKEIKTKALILNFCNYALYAARFALCAMRYALYPPNPQLATRNSQPTTRNPQPTTRNSQHATRLLPIRFNQSEICNLQSAIEKPATRTIYHTNNDTHYTLGAVPASLLGLPAVSSNGLNRKRSACR